MCVLLKRQVFPENLPSRFPSDEDYNDQSEIDRREEYIRLLTSKEILPDAERHPLTRIMKQCLSYRDTERPDTVEVMQMLQSVRTNSDLDEPLIVSELLHTTNYYAYFLISNHWFYVFIQTDQEREIEIEELMEKYASTIDVSIHWTFTTFNDNIII